MHARSSPQTFRVAPSVGAVALVGAASCTRVQATLRVEPGGRRGALPHVTLQLGVRRAAPELLAKGWAQPAPFVHTRFTAEQKALLLELFENPDRLNETQMHTTFIARFSDASGPYARQLRLSCAQIKSFMSKEKARRQKAAARGVVAGG